MDGLGYKKRAQRLACLRTDWMILGPVKMYEVEERQEICSIKLINDKWRLGISGICLSIFTRQYPAYLFVDLTLGDSFQTDTAALAISYFKH
jgi:hypothetical protein